ncbi:MAG: class II aldolase/adducin family protein [Planctomycetes bacterium]|nr:class II aldolase/adducin family protein [Planctomycetota bacterium]
MSTILHELVSAARELVASGLVTGAGGNVSARAGDVLYVSPSGYSLADAGPDDYARVSVASGEVAPGSRRPSSEVLMHLYLYRARPDVAAVLHAHPRKTIALTAAGHDLRPIFPDYHVYLGAEVPHLDYVTVTTEALARAVEQALRPAHRRGVVLRNHGALTVGASVKEALFRAQAIEEQADIQWCALQVGTPRYLTAEECAELDALASEAYRRELLARMRSDA